MLCGLLVALTLQYLPGPGGHSPALGFQMGGAPPVDRHLPGIILASLATLSLGAVLGPEAPLIAIGGGLAALTVRLVKKDVTPMAVTIMASAGSFVAISTLLGSPAARRLPHHGSGRASPGRPSASSHCPACSPPASVPLVFLGLDDWTGLGTFSLALTTVPPGVDPTVASLLWAIPVGLLGALLGWAVRWVGLTVRPVVHRRQAAGHRRARRAHRPHRHGLPAHHRKRLHRGALLGPGRPARPRGHRRRLLRGDAGRARPVQDAGLRACR